MDGYVAVHQASFIEVGKRGFGAAIDLLDYNCS
jgi:hypothetical protein